MKVLFSCILMFVAVQVNAQNPFVGKLTYSIQIADTAMRDMFQTSTMTIYTNDTILRIETSTETLGTQVLIQHIEKKKSYLLIDTPMGNFAIQIPSDTAVTEKKYVYKKVDGQKQMLDLKCSKLEVTNTVVAEKLPFYYHKNISAKYLPGFEDFPGLLTDYYVISKDGLYHHQLIELKHEDVNRDLFGIPSDYERISMDAFVDKMTQNLKTTEAAGE